MDVFPDPYEHIAVFYDCEHEAFQEDIDFFRAHIAAGPVLDVGAGTGRVGAALALNGLDVVALEPSEAMLVRARARFQGLEQVQLRRGTITDLDTPARFGAVIFSLNVLWHIPSLEGQLTALRAALAQLRPGGKLYVDLSNPLNLADRGGAGLVRQRFRGPCAGGTLTVNSAAWDDTAAQILLLSLSYDFAPANGPLERTVGKLKLRYVFRPELELMARLSGFADIRMYGDYDLGEYTDQSARLFLIAARP